MIRMGIQSKAEAFTEALVNAEARGDHNMARTMRVELTRTRRVNPAGLPPRETADPEPLERAVPPAPKRMGRPPKPRCEHGQIPERCARCNEEIPD